MIEKACERVDWPRRRREIEEENGRRTDGRRRGLGLACSYRGRAWERKGSTPPG